LLRPVRHFSHGYAGYQQRSQTGTLSERMRGRCRLARVPETRSRPADFAS
jgi:hypothetical protein